MLNQFKNLSCYKEFEMRCSLTGISKVDVLKEIGYKVNGYYFFISKDGIFNWFDLNGNHVENPGILREIGEYHIPLNISKCIIPNGVTSIGNKSFSYCKLLKEIIIPNTVINIGGEAFIWCSSLKEINIPDSVTHIGDKAFSYCTSLESISIPDSVTHIGFGAFFGCESLKEAIFKWKTLKNVKQMENCPFGIGDENVFKFT